MAHKNKRISKKIQKLRREGKPQNQAAAIAYSMEKKGKLGSKGGYKRSKKK